MGHGGVADEIKGRRGQPSGGGERLHRVDPGHRGGGGPLSLLPGRRRAVHGPGDVDGGPGGAGLGHRARVRRVHARFTSPATTPPARWSAPTAGWRAAWTGTSATARRARPSTGSSRAASSTTCGWSRTGAVAASRCDGIAIGGSLGQDKAQMHEVVDWTTAELERLAPDRPRHLLGIGEIDDLIVGVRQGIDTFDCAMPTRLGRHGVALIPDPARRWRVDLVKGRWRRSREPILEGCPCPACAAGLLPRLPALPAARPRAHRPAAGDAAQPQLHRAADGRPARRDRRRPAALRWPPRSWPERRLLRVLVDQAVTWLITDWASWATTLR